MNDAVRPPNSTAVLGMLEGNRAVIYVNRAVTRVEGENSERRVPFADVYARAESAVNRCRIKVFSAASGGRTRANPRGS